MNHAPSAPNRQPPPTPSLPNASLRNFNAPPALTPGSQQIASFLHRFTRLLLGRVGGIES